eukprot:CAMPEP_0119338388 /NCGR_PEP_ID=MMETSP1333-20130426/95912_1 /TAXON_ID=418940 /ORGANISM="Scyphosphaera apsteinii, Strain RCC1455" /LENGTH=252 /DNA_ID=CAMNT_0007349635 /DNA_START=427 /DNA_END=1186 /DNA_ORIENTATION=+
MCIRAAVLAHELGAESQQGGRSSMRSILEEGCGAHRSTPPRRPESQQSQFARAAAIAPGMHLPHSRANPVARQPQSFLREARMKYDDNLEWLFAQEEEVQAEGGLSSTALARQLEQQEGNVGVLRVALVTACLALLAPQSIRLGHEVVGSVLLLSCAERLLCIFEEALVVVDRCKPRATLTAAPPRKSTSQMAARLDSSRQNVRERAAAAEKIFELRVAVLRLERLLVQHTASQLQLHYLLPVHARLEALAN